MEFVFLNQGVPKHRVMNDCQIGQFSKLSLNPWGMREERTGEKQMMEVLTCAGPPWCVGCLAPKVWACLLIRSFLASTAA